MKQCVNATGYMNNASLTQYDSGRDMASVQIRVQEDLAEQN